ncbi:hypothetical protein OROHE_000343 [Orobanche hederae]
MKAQAFIFVALVLVSSVLAEEHMMSREETKEVAHNEPKGDEPMHPTTFGRWFGGYGGEPSTGGAGGGTDGGAGGGATDGGAAGGGTTGGDGGASGDGAGGYSAGFSHGGVYGGGQVCKLGCCSKSYGYSHGGGGYYGCTCCRTAAEAKAYKENQAKAETKN